LETPWSKDNNQTVRDFPFATTNVVLNLMPNTFVKICGWVVVNISFEIDTALFSKPFWTMGIEVRMAGKINS